MASIKKNYILNLINTIAGILFPIVSFPYVSRILLPEGIGEIQFFNSIITYISLFTSLGIPLYAVRELARVRNNFQARNKLTIEILFLHGFLTLLGYIVIFIIASTVSRIEINTPLFYLLSLVLFFNAIGVEWFYQAMEEFKYITVRSLSIRILSIVALFCFVKNQEDLLYYAAIQVVGTVGNNLFNFIHLRKYLQLSKRSFTELNFRKHLKYALRLFILNLIISIYVNLDTVMLGFLKNNEIVGFYTGAVKLTKTFLGIISSFGVVLLPRFSNLISEGQQDEFVRLANKAVSFTIAMVLPMSTGLFILSEPLIILFCGPAYAPSVLTSKILSPIIIFIGLSGILGMQILYPQGKERVVIISTLVGAILNFSINIVLIPLFSQNGAATASLIAEFSVLSTLLIVGKKYLPFDFFNRQNQNYLFGTILMAIAVLLILQFPLNNWQTIIICPIVGAGVYICFLISRKDPFYVILKEILLKKHRKIK